MRHLTRREIEEVDSDSSDSVTDSSDSVYDSSDGDSVQDEEGAMDEGARAPRSSPLADSIRQRNLKLVSSLIEDGHDVNGGWSGDLPIVAAAATGNVFMIKDLATRGARLDAVDKNGDTALCVAARKNNAHVVDQLLECGANPNVRDMHGKTPSCTRAAKSEPPSRNPSFQATLTCV
jgi:ankyrin repeat protein